MSPKGKYFHIKSKSSGLYLDVKGASTAPGTLVILWNKSDADNQLWYHDPLTHTIRSKQSNHCLDINGNNRLVINSYRHGDAGQYWGYDKSKNAIEGKGNKVLDVFGGAKTAGTEICSFDRHGGDNQKWEIEARPSRFFYIRSDHAGKVLDVSGGSKSPGAKVILYGKKSSGNENQLWYEDIYGNIRSKLSDDLALDASSGILHTGKYVEGKSRTFWALSGNKIVNVHNQDEVLDVKDNKKDDGAEICAWKYHGAGNQHWHIDFV